MVERVFDGHLGHGRFRLRFFASTYLRPLPIYTASELWTSASLTHNTIMISDAQFKQAVHIINNPPKSGWGNAPPKIDRFKLDVQELLERDIARPSDDRINLQSQFYGLYKQATEGDNHTPRPANLSCLIVYHELTARVLGLCRKIRVECLESSRRDW